ncbi:MAG TPA: 3-oxoacyl-[acyl-carrier-protein] synthase III C-terminal domain-containing protein [Woeseiaceae bacterium]
MTEARACLYQHELYLSSPQIVLPATRVSNEDLVARVRSRFMGDAREWRKIERRLQYVFGLFGSEYRYLEDGEPRPLHEYAAEIVSACLEAERLLPEDIDAVIYGGVCREYFEPATAVQIAAAAGILRPAVALDVSAACAGVLNAIITFAALAATDTSIRRGIVASIEGTGRQSDELGMICYDIQEASDLMGRAAGLTIGNAGGAMLVSTAPLRDGGRLLASLTETYAQHHALSTAHVNGTFECDSFGLFREWRLFPPHIRKLADALGWSADDIAWFCVHQPSDRLVEKIAASFSIPQERVPRLHAEFGNTVTLSPVMALESLARRGALRAGDRIIISAAGSGITLTSLAVEWLGAAQA